LFIETTVKTWTKLGVDSNRLLHHLSKMSEDMSAQVAATARSSAPGLLPTPKPTPAPPCAEEIPQVKDGAELVVGRRSYPVAPPVTVYQLPPGVVPRVPSCEGRAPLLPTPPTFVGVQGTIIPAPIHDSTHASTPPNPYSTATAYPGLGHPGIPSLMAPHTTLTGHSALSYSYTPAFVYAPVPAPISAPAPTLNKPVPTDPRLRRPESTAPPAPTPYTVAYTPGSYVSFMRKTASCVAADADDLKPAKRLCLHRDM
jgi:hypothetical protein